MGAAQPAGADADSASDLRQDQLVRNSFAHDAVISMDSDADMRAPGAAITVALCGHWGA